MTNSSIIHIVRLAESHVKFSKDHSHKGKEIFCWSRRVVSLFTCDLYEILFALRGQYREMKLIINHTEINDKNLLLGKIRDKAEYEIIIAITQHTNHLFIVIPYWEILWYMAHIIINVIKMKLIYKMLLIASYNFFFSG